MTPTDTIPVTARGEGELSELDMVRICARAMNLDVREVSQNEPQHTVRMVSHGNSYWPITRPEQAWALANRFPLIASGVFSAVAIARHDGETDPRLVDAARLLVECVAKRRSAPTVSPLANGDAK